MSGENKNAVIETAQSKLYVSVQHLLKRKEDGKRTASDSYYQHQESPHKIASQTPEDGEVCRGCGSKCKRLLAHLAKKLPCQDFYDMDSMREGSKNRKRQQQQAWQAANREAHRIAQQQYQTSHQEQRKLSQKKYRSTHREKLKQSQREYQSTHRERRQQSQEEYRFMHREQLKEARRRYYASHKEERRQAEAARYQKHREEIRRRRKLQACVGVNVSLCKVEDSL